MTLSAVLLLGSHQLVDEGRAERKRGGVRGMQRSGGQERCDRRGF